MPAATQKKKPSATAFFHVSYSHGAIDAENGVIRGVRLMEIGKLAKFAAEDGSPKQVTITDNHITALLNHAGNRAIPVHLTHEWFDAQGKPNADSVELAARIGALKAFRRDEAGNLIADAFFKAGAVRDDMLFAAAHNPEDTMFSVVFNYRPDDANCIPINFRAADVVPTGAAVTALFSETQTSNTMTVEELVSMLSDPAVKTALKAILDSHEGEAPPAAEMESAAGVTDEDRKKEDDAMPATMRAFVRTSRAIARQTAALKADKAALFAEVETKAAAAATALLGKGGIVRSTGTEADSKLEEAKNFITAQMTNGCPNQATAIARLAKDKPELYAVYRA